MDYAAFSDEIKLQVGERVWIDIPEVPLEQRETDTGLIVKINTRFPTTPSHRVISYTVRFDNKGNYVKKEYRYFGGIRFEATFDIGLGYVKPEREKP